VKIVWTKEALDRLTEIEKFIALDSPKRARHFVADLVREGESLSKNPRIGRVVAEISNPAVREWIFKNYRIVYRLRKECLEILTVFEGHRLFRQSS
jgi:toxin ParE1/3/4